MEKIDIVSADDRLLDGWMDSFKAKDISQSGGTMIAIEGTYLNDYGTIDVECVIMGQQQQLRVLDKNSHKDCRESRRRR